MDFLRFKKFLPAIAFFSGFAWDSLTLTRIDRLTDNVILLFYLLILGVLIVIVNIIERSPKVNLHPILMKYKQWYPFAIQFLLGGLFSAYVVFYFQSASFTKTAVFFALLLLLFVINEFLGKKYTNLYLQISLFFLVNFSFFIFFVPVLFGHIGLVTFLTGSLISLTTAEGIIFLLKRQSVFTDELTFRKTAGIPIMLTALLIFFYSANWIPPVPLALRFSGIYHNIEKTTGDTGTSYSLTFQGPPWYRPFKTTDNPFIYREGDRVYCFSSVFAPTDLAVSIYHRWQRFDGVEGQWLVSDTIPLDISGGRDDGYRLYTFKERIEPGDWRVDVATENGIIIGRISFSVIKSESSELKFASIVR